MHVYISICACCLGKRACGHHVPSVDVLGGWASCVADLSHGTRPMGSTQGDTRKVGLLFILLKMEI